MQTKDIAYIDVLMNKESNYDETTDTIVPDLYPDISRIISVCAKPYIKDTSIQSDRILISGEIKAKVLYIPEDSTKPEVMNIVLSFAHIEDMKVTEPLVYSSATLNNVEARIVNPRKISILASVKISTKVYKKNNLSLKSLDEADVEILPYKKEIMLIDSINVNEFVLADDVSGWTDCEIFDITPSIAITDVKILKNKLMLRGNIDFTGNYIEDGEIKQLNKTTQFSQIVDVKIEDENLEYEIELCSKSFDFEQLENGDFSYSLCVKMSMIQLRQETLDLIYDMYDTKKDINVSKKECTLYSKCKTENERVESVVSIECSNILDEIVFCNVYVDKKINQNKTYDIFANVSGIYKSENQMYDFCDCVKVCENIDSTNIDIENISCSANKGTSNEIQVKVCFNLKKSKSEKIKFDVIEDFEKCGDKQAKSNVIILKYITKEENLWNIAKKYNTRVCDIIEANNLEKNTTIISDTMMLIPVK